ncbi:VOC family protein [Ichthyenterobacterium sp. W332]|uniref:VOC family protein n=1 Tax=Microcosmobacter mediterraneus TaxID=3075607 RepID=A0ABU2YGW9_9FLAO|nr:VOC family protein [Ichthyenterobacterium sp. W332]MDT0557422.1 VOC family protein [Ichthyenterobacterium sp. W332]
MIKGLYETHLFVENLERSIAFYSETLGLKQCRLGTERRTAFFWIGEDKQFMLGLWEKPKEEIDIRHFAFQCDPEWVLKHSVEFLKSKQLNFWNFLNNDKEQPMVFCWMPAISIYFNDPDGHDLEFIGILPGKSKSNEEKRVVTYEEWLSIKED